MKASDDTEGKPRHLLVPRFHQARGKKGEPIEEVKPEPKKGNQIVIGKPLVKKEAKVDLSKTPKVTTEATVKKFTSSTNSQASTIASFQSASPATVPRGQGSSA